MLYLFFKNKFNIYFLSTLFVSLLIFCPIAIIFVNSFEVNFQIWEHIYNYLLYEYIVNSLILVGGVVCLSLILGVSAAWFISFYKLPFKNIISILLILPIAIPPYAVAYSYADITDFGGPLSNFLSYIGLNLKNENFISARSLFGGIIILSFTLFPYIYLICRYSFSRHSSRIMEAASNLGASRKTLLFKIALPLSRPAIAAGVALVMMETLADFGVVHYLGIDSLSVGIYKAWFGLNDLSSSSRLSSLLLLFALSAILLEKISRNDKSEKFISYNSKTISKSYFFSENIYPFIFILLLLVLTLFIPIVWLISLTSFDNLTEFDVIKAAINSLILSFFGALIIVVVSLFICFSQRIFKRGLSFLVSIAKIGYASPGIVIAIGVIVPVIFIDKKLSYIFNSLFDINIGLLISSSFIILLFGYLVRFFAVGYNSVEAAFEKVSRKIDFVAAGLGTTRIRTFIKIHFPLISYGAFIGYLLVFIEIMKELPATLILRPLNFNTLSVYTFEYASSEQLNHAATTSLIITVLGFIPLLVIFLLLKKMDYK